MGGPVELGVLYFRVGKKCSENVLTLFNRPKHPPECPSACGMASYIDILLVDNRWSAQIEVIDSGGPLVYR